jgi:hypothetical protein
MTLESNPSPSIKRNINIYPPSAPVTPIPTFNPTGQTRITNEPTKSSAPTTSQTREKPKIVKEEQKVVAITCENAFPDDLQTMFPNSNFVVTDPPLTDIVVTYIYEAFIDNTADKNVALSEMEYQMFFSVLSSSTWMTNGVPTENCPDLLRDALGLTSLNENRKMLVGDGDWSYFLGWKNEPADSFKDGATCATETVKEGSTCYPIVGKITAQVPIDKEISPIIIQTQVMSNIKSSVENDEFLSENVLDMKFLGQTMDTNVGGGFDGPTTRNTEKPNVLSAFGITAICALSVASVLIMVVFGIMRRRKRNQGDFEEIQNDAIALGTSRSDDPETPKLSRNVFTETSPDGVEIVDLDGVFSGVGAPVGDTNTISSSGTGKRGFNLGSFMDSLRGKDDLSYASGPSKHGDARSLADDSAISVETEDYGNARAFRSDL